MVSPAKETLIDRLIRSKCPTLISKQRFLPFAEYMSWKEHLPLMLSIKNLGRISQEEHRSVFANGNGFLPTSTDKNNAFRQTNALYQNFFFHRFLIFVSLGRTVVSFSERKDRESDEILGDYS